MSATNEISIEVLKIQVLALQKHQGEQDSLLLELRRERDQAMKWGLITLGSLVVSMGALIVNSMREHIK